MRAGNVRYENPRERTTTIGFSRPPLASKRVAGALGKIASRRACPASAHDPLKRLLALSLAAAAFAFPFHVKHASRVPPDHRLVCLDLGFNEDGSPISVCR